MRAGVVPNGLVPLQSNWANPDEPLTTDAVSGVKVAQLLVSNAVVAGMPGNVCVKRVVAAYATPIVDIRRREMGARYFLAIFNVSISPLLRCSQH